MDYIKVQCELLKEYGKNKEPKSFITSIDNFTYASVNGRWCAVIPTEKWLLNLPETPKFEGFKSLLKTLRNGNAKIVEVTDITDKSKDFTAIKLTCEEFDVWVNKKFLAFFGTPSKLKILAFNKLTPIYIYDNVTNDLLGVIGAIRKM